MSNTDDMSNAQRAAVLAALSGADPRTARKFVEGGHVDREAVRDRLERAARQLQVMIVADRAIVKIDAALGLIQSPAARSLLTDAAKMLGGAEKEAA